MITTSQHGAPADAWEHCVLFLDIGADLLPIVSNPDAQISPNSKLKGLGKIPSTYDQQKRVVGIPDWTNRTTTSADIEAWSQEPDFGIGVQCRTVRAIDIDVDDEADAKRIQVQIEDAIGFHLPTRSRPLSGRRLLAFKYVAELSKQRVEVPGGVVEILGLGQQFVALGRHPSGEHYEWDDLGPGGLPTSIPCLDLDGLMKVFEVLNLDTGKLTSDLSAKASTRTQATDDLMTLMSGQQIEHLRSALHFLALTQNYDQHDSWAGIGAALHSLGETGRTLWIKFSELCGNGGPGIAEDKWETLKSDRTGYPSIFAKAQALGWKNPLKMDDAESLITAFKKMTRAELLDVWAARTAQIPKDQVPDVLAVLGVLTGIKPRPLSAALKDARRALDHERKLAAIGKRHLFVYRPQDSVEQAKELGALILKSAAPGALVNYAGRPSRIVEAYQPRSHHIDDDDLPPPLTMVVEPHTQTSMRAEAEAVAVMHCVRASDMIPIAIPPLILEALLELDAANAPRISGVISHPITRIDGTLVTKNGIDSQTEMFVHSIPENLKLKPYSQNEAEVALLRLKESFLSGFEFASILNSDIAIAGLFTALQRRLMDVAPGLAILAPSQSSGKTTLARRIHLLVTGRDMPVVNLPVGDEAEIQKLLLALLLVSPAIITFDNISDGLVVHGGPLNAAMTSPTYEGRLLGSSKTVHAPTNTFMCLTGNNLRMGSDEVSRWLTTSLVPGSARPEERKFRDPDVVGHALTIRDQVLKDVMGIVSGFLTSGTKLQLSTGTRFNRWDRMVRQPLIWAGADDVAKCFAINSSEAEHVQALRSLLILLGEEFGDRTFSTRDLIHIVEGFDGNKSDAIKDALAALRVRDSRNVLSVGKALQACLDRPVDIDEQTFSLSARLDRQKTNRFMVSKCG